MITSPDSPTPLAWRELLDKQSIHELILTYCRSIDRLDVQGVRDCFHPDASDTHGSFHGDAEEFIGWAFKLLKRYDATMHLVANHLATIRGEVAVSETYGISHHRSDNPDPRLNLTVGFRYIDRLERRDGSTWKIAQRIATTEWVRAPGQESEWPIPKDSATGSRDNSDPLFEMLRTLEK